MNNIKNILQQIGLSEGEVDIYLAGLSLGPCLASTLAKKINLSRTLSYHLIELLEKKGLTSKVKTPQGYLYSMEPPHKLVALLDTKKEALDKVSKNLQNVIPTMESFSSEELRQAKVKFYEGIEGMKNVVMETLNAKIKEVYSFMPGLNVIEKTFGREFIEDYIKKRDKNNIEVKNIWSEVPDRENPISEIVSKNIRVAPDLNFQSTVIIHDDKTTVLSSEKYLSAFVVENQEFADTIKSFFNEIWKHSNSVIE